MLFSINCFHNLLPFSTLCRLHSHTSWLSKLGFLIILFLNLSSNRVIVMNFHVQIVEVENSFYDIQVVIKSCFAWSSEFPPIHFVREPWRLDQYPLFLQLQVATSCRSSLQSH